MREHVVTTLQTLTKNGKPITDADMITWANGLVKSSGKATSSISSFKDPALSNGIFLLDLLNVLKKGIVNYEMVEHGVSGAKYEF